MSGYWKKIPGRTQKEMLEIFMGHYLVLVRGKEHWRLIHHSPIRELEVMKSWWGNEYDNKTSEDAHKEALAEGYRLQSLGFGRLL